MCVKTPVYKSFGKCEKCYKHSDDLYNTLCESCYIEMRKKHTLKANSFPSALHSYDMEFILHKISQLVIVYQQNIVIDYDVVPEHKMFTNIRIYKDDELVGFNYDNLNPQEIVDYLYKIEKLSKKS